MGSFREHTTSKWDFCLFGTHCHRGCYIISIVGMAMSLILFGLNFVWHTYLLVVPSLLSIFCYICLLVGNRTRTPVLYFPMFFGNTLALIVTLLLGLMYAVGCGMLLLSYGKTIINDDHFGIAMMSIMAIVHITFGFIEFYFIYVAFKSYRYLKEILLCPYENYRENCGVKVIVY